MTDLNERIAALREAVEKMTPGEWLAGRASLKDGSISPCTFVFTSSELVADCSTGPDTHGDEGDMVGVNNAAGIVAVRNNALAIIDEQQREIASRDAEIERLKDIDMRFSEREPAALRSRLRDAESEIERLREELEISARVVLDINADRIHLRARVVELETPPTEQARWMNVSPLRDAGPTELRGRITRRTE